MLTQGAVLERVERVQHCAVNNGVTTTMWDLLSFAFIPKHTCLLMILFRQLVK